jgi:hypothetical protein
VAWIESRARGYVPAHTTALAREQGENPQRLYWWKRRLREEEARSTSNFVEVSITARIGLTLAESSTGSGRTAEESRGYSSYGSISGPSTRSDPGIRDAPGQVLFLKADDNAEVGVPLLVGGSALTVGPTCRAASGTSAFEAMLQGDRRWPRRSTP